MNREEIKNFIINIEQNYDVNKWTANDLKLWPVIRIWLFFYLFNKHEEKITGSIKVKRENNQRVYIKFKILVKNILQIPLYCYWFFKLPKKLNVFVANSNHRVNYLNKSYNRFFDFMIDNEGIKDSSVFFDYDNQSIDKKYNNEILIDFYKMQSVFIYFSRFFKKRINFEWKEYEQFIVHLKNNDCNELVDTLLNQHKIEKWYISNFIHKVHFFKKVFQKIKPSKVYFLCFYSSEPLSMLVAANYLNIETIDFQHGPQTDLHMCYANWTNIPRNGYEFLPNTFYCWDENSANVIKQWSDKYKNYKTKVYGNPWVEYWKTKTATNNKAKYVLYSLQTFTIEKHFPKVILNAIKELPYIWYIRLHPRQIELKNNLIRFLKENEVFSKVNIDDATEMALPQVLISSIINITHYSGVAIEANMLNKKTIFISEIAVKSFPELIKNKNAYYLDLSISNFSSKLNDLIQSEIHNSNKYV